MKKQNLHAILLVCALIAHPAYVLPTAAQQDRPPSPPDARTQQQAPPVDATDDEVVQITTNLVQVDAVVTDRDGRQVTDLRAEDFEISENGERQPITNFSYVQLAPEPAAVSAPSRADRLAAAPAPPARLRPEQVRRTIALVVDDINLSFEGTAYVNRALKKFVDEQVGANDLVAIIRTRAGIGAFQQFTLDRRQLYAAIERVRWYPLGRGGLSVFSPDVYAGSDDAQDRREETFSVGTLGALDYVVRGLGELPGRKSVVLFSEGIPLFNSGGYDNRVTNALRRLIDSANRASVIVYTIDARALQVNDQANNANNPLTPRANRGGLFANAGIVADTRGALQSLAAETGGFLVRNSNDISEGVARVLHDQSGYYLIGYRPDEATFDPVTGARRFHKITIKVRRPGLQVRTRGGFFGMSGRGDRPKPNDSRGGKLVRAITSPFDAGAVTLRLTSLFGNDREKGSFVRSLLHIDGRDLTFEPQPDGSYKVAFDIVAVASNDFGQSADHVAFTQRIDVRKDGYERARRNGFVYTLNVPVKRAGAYQLRVAVRDAASDASGSASQFLEAPNIAKDQLSLSGVVVSGTRVYPQASEVSNATPETPIAGTDAVQAVPAVRRFRAGMILDYNYVVYNARLDRTSGRPQLETQARLFRDGEEVATAQPTPLDADRQPDLKRLVAAGRLPLNQNLKPGYYILQVVATDLLAKGKRRDATQFIDLEIVD